MMNCKVLNVKIDEYEDKMNEILNSGKYGKYRRLDVLYCDGKNMVTQIIFDVDDMSEDVLSDSLTKNEIKALNEYIGKQKKGFSGVNYWLKVKYDKTLTVGQMRACGYEVKKIGGSYYVWKEKKNETN